MSATAVVPVTMEHLIPAGALGPGASVLDVRSYWSFDVANATFAHTCHSPGRPLPKCPLMAPFCVNQPCGVVS
jgi:hypothetical protein